MVLLSEFGIAPDTGKDLSEEFKKLFEYCKVNNISSIKLEKGIYDFFSENSVEKACYIPGGNSGADYLQNKAIAVKTGILLEGMKNFCLDGDGSKFLIHGYMTNMIIVNCIDVFLKNLIIEETFPFVELNAIEVEKKYAIFRHNKDISYEIKKKKLFFNFGDYSYPINFQYKDAVKNRCLKGNSLLLQNPLKNPFLKEKCASSFGEGFLKIKFTKKPKINTGDTYGIFIKENLQAGIIINSSSKISLYNIEQNSCASYAILATESSFLTFTNISIIPAEGSFISAPADACRFIMCGGKIAITNSSFMGIGGNAVDLHGNYFPITEIDGKTVVVKFTAPVNGSFDPFDEGDVLEFIDTEIFEKITLARVESSEIIGTDTIRIVLKNLPSSVKSGDIIENVSKSPDLIFCNNYVLRVAGNGISAATRGKIEISGNTFDGVDGNCILFSNDTAITLESGRIQNAFIMNNIFDSCKKPAISVLAKGYKKDVQAHKNITVSGNKFCIKKKVPPLTIRNCRNVKVYGNTVLEKNK